MGESICLPTSSFSQPAEISSLYTKEAAPHHVLTESVSFGRFASESLQWEKWSAFCQNRYVEEAERFIKPGSVAQKKAFFEAHFKKSSAVRSTRTKFEAVNVKTSNQIVCENDLVEEEDNVEVEPVAPSTCVIDEATDVQSGKLKVTTHVENLNSMPVPKGGALVEENSTSLSKESRPPGSSGSKLEPSFVIGLDPPLKKTRKQPPSSNKRSISVSKNQKRIPSVPFQVSTSCAPLGNIDINIARIPKYVSRNSTNAKGAGKADRKKGSGPSTVYMSLNFTASACQTTKRAPKASTIQETASSNARYRVFPNGNKPTKASKSRKRPLLQTDKEGSDVAKCSTSASAVSLPDLHPPKNRPSEDKRKNITTESSVSCSIPNNLQGQPSGGSKNLSSHSRTRANSFTVACPFNFRSDERAEKRKEFFKKVEEKNKKADAAIEPLSSGFKANHSTHVASEQQKNPKASLVRLNSPRFRKNQAPGNEKTKKFHQPPHKVVSAKTINTRNASMEKYKGCKIHPSSKSKTNKRAQENSSPNILES